MTPDTCPSRARRVKAISTAIAVGREHAAWMAGRADGARLACEYAADATTLRAELARVKVQLRDAEAQLRDAKARLRDAESRLAAPPPAPVPQFRWRTDAPPTMTPLLAVVAGSRPAICTYREMHHGRGAWFDAAGRAAQVQRWAEIPPVAP